MRMLEALSWQQVAGNMQFFKTEISANISKKPTKEIILFIQVRLVATFSQVKQCMK